MHTAERAEKFQAIKNGAYKLAALAELVDSDAFDPEQPTPLSERGRMGLRKILEGIANDLFDSHDGLR